MARPLSSLVLGLAPKAEAALDLLGRVAPTLRVLVLRAIPQALGRGVPEGKLDLDGVAAAAGVGDERVGRVGVLDARAADARDPVAQGDAAALQRGPEDVRDTNGLVLLKRVQIQP